MSKGGRGRPTKNTNTAKVIQLVVEFLSTKKDNYDQEISYFQIVDTAFRMKLKPLFSLNDDGSLKMPIMLTDKNGNILKVETKFIVNIQDLMKNAVHVINLSFEYYNMEELVAKGYYAKITNVVSTNVPPGIEVEVADDN